MNDVLKKICDQKRKLVQERMGAMPLAEVQAAAKEADPPRGFAQRLRKEIEAGRFGLIAEIKRASPSKGRIRDDFNEIELARAYERGGATCLSVLTETPNFEGEDQHLINVRDAVGLPVLRKDFMLEPYQIFESRALGADCILLIMAALSDAEAAELESVAGELGMDVLVEVHDGEELDRALKLMAALLGINNRNLKTLEVDLGTTEELARRAPSDRIVVSESGLNTPEDLARMARAGAKCFLIGESFMRQDDVEAAVKSLLFPVGAV